MSWPKRTIIKRIRACFGAGEIHAWCFSTRARSTISAAARTVDKLKSRSTSVDGRANEAKNDTYKQLFVMNRKVNGQQEYSSQSEVLSFFSGSAGLVIVQTSSLVKTT
jgi:hypothetical protein